ncbi:MAG: signal peptidase I [Acholeplasmataceae bacterium]
MQKKENIKKALGISLNVFFYSVIIVLLIFSIANIQVKRQDDIPNIFNRGFLAVQSDSMEGDLPDNFNKGDMIFVEMLDDAARDDLEVGDIVTFFDMGIRAFNTHRIIEIFTENDIKYLVTQGDNTEGSDNPIQAAYAVAVYRSSWAGAGETLSYLQSPVGFALFVIMPVFLILIYEGISLGRNVLAMNKVKLEEKMLIEKEAAKLELEAEKARMKQELLEEMRKEKESKA